MNASPTRSQISGGNHYAKYETKHRIEKWLVSHFLETVEELAHCVHPKEVHEVGCGEGEVTRRLLESGLNVRGTDQCASTIGDAKQRQPAHAHRFGVLDFTQASLEYKAPLVVCCEVLEHVADPHSAVEALYRLADPYLIASVPNEPLWRVLNMARGKYWREWGNTPGHEHHWSSHGLASLLSSHFDVLVVRRPLPWTVVLATKRKPKQD